MERSNNKLQRGWKTKKPNNKHKQGIEEEEETI